MSVWSGPIRPVGELPPVVTPPAPEWAPNTTPKVNAPGRVASRTKTPEETLPLVQAPELPADPKKDDDGPYPYVGVPGRNLIFKLESPDELERRIVRELADAQKQPGKPAPDAKGFAFPALPKLSPDDAVYTPKTDGYPALAKHIEPAYVVHRRLYFEEVNSERYGWDMGVLQPVVSTLHFYKDVIWYPARVGSNMCERYDASAGKCLPGSPVPYFLYPPEIDIWGATLGVGMYVGVAAILP